MMDVITICTHCGAIIETDDFHRLENAILCEDCYENHTFICSHCAERVYEENNSGTSDFPLCSYCYNEYYTVCEDCGRIVNFEDSYQLGDYDYCCECHSRRTNRPIHDYNYKPEPIFYGEGSRYLGVELEIDYGGEYTESAEQILDTANSSADHIYIKHDGSLEEGLEIVTHPMTLDYHMHNMNWADITRTALSLDYLSHKTSTCGLHVHVNRSSLAKEYFDQERVIGNILYLVEKFWDKLLVFSRRTEEQLNRWASRYGYKNSPKDVYKGAKESYSGRYKCVNIQNSETVEFRIFRGTLKTNTIIATLQMVNEICNVAVSLSETELQKLTWNGFIEMIMHNKELSEYLNERSLAEVNV